MQQTALPLAPLNQRQRETHNVRSPHSFQNSQTRRIKLHSYDHLRVVIATLLLALAPGALALGGLLLALLSLTAGLAALRSSLLSLAARTAALRGGLLGATLLGCHDEKLLEREKQCQTRECTSWLPKICILKCHHNYG